MDNIIEYLDMLNRETLPLSEADYDRMIEHVKLELMDQERFIKQNDVKEVSNPVFFQTENVPTPDGLLSNEIFGITKETRAGTFAYIDLGGVFMDPSCYKVWSRLDSNIKACVHGTDNFIISPNGDLVQNDNGKSGIKFIKDNFDKIKIRSTESVKRDFKIQYLKANKDRMFITKYMVIPAYYRDVMSGKNTGVGEINRLYSQLIVAIRGYKEVAEYGISTTAQAGRIQEIILAIYDWFAGNNNNLIKEAGTGSAGKTGIVRRSLLSKTADYSARLVISAPDAKVESVDDLKVDIFHSSLPLAAAITNFKPYIIFHVRRFFENTFAGLSTIPAIDKNGKVIYLTPKDPLIEFSDERIKDEIHNFIYSYSNRIKPIMIPMEEREEPYFTIFKGNIQTDKKDQNVESITQRRLCWIDVFYQAAVEAVKDKVILITRFPIDSFYSQFPNEIIISSTKETEPMMVLGEYYPYYPKIREEDVNADTSNYFIDTLSTSNLHLKSIGGDYDGDQVTSKGAYYKETNEEQREYLHSKAFFINQNGINVRVPDNEAVQSLYNLTKVLPETKLTDPVF